MFDRTAFEGARRERFSALVVNAIQGLAADGSALQRGVVAALAKVSRNLGLHLPCWCVTCCDHARSAQADLRDLDIDPKEVLVAAGVADQVQGPLPEPRAGPAHTESFIVCVCVCGCVWVCVWVWVWVWVRVWV